MKTFLKKISTYAPSSLLTSVLQTVVGIALAYGLWNCSGGSGMFSSSSGRLQAIQIPMSLVYKPAASLNLESGSGSGLNLLGSGTSLTISVSGCGSGYTISDYTLIGTNVNLYKTDNNCLVKLRSFVYQGLTYSATATGATNFTTWLSGDTATFANVAGSGAPGDLIAVFVGSQVTQGGVSGSDTIVYNFTDIAAGTTSTLSQNSVSTAVPISATGKAAPNYAGPNTGAGGVFQARYISTNSNGSANMSFTIACASSVTGTTPNFTCPNSDGSGDVQSVAISYTMVPDAYGACTTTPTTLTVANANTIFAGSVFAGQTVTAVPNTLSATSGSPGAAGQIGPAGTDNWGNTGVTNGGFSTVTMLTGATAIYSGASGSYANGYQYLNDILIIRRRDASANTLSYLYYCVNIAAITQN